MSETKMQEECLLGSTVPGNSSEGAPRRGACVWRLDEDGIYQTACGHEFASDDGSCDWVQFCFNCGAPRQDPPKCSECYGTGRTDNHVTGEVECSACDGTGQGEAHHGEPARTALPSND